MAPIIPFIPLIAAGIGAAATGVEIADMPKAPSTNSTQTAQASTDAAQAEASALVKRRGMASTVLTSPMGAGGADVGKSTLG